MSAKTLRLLGLAAAGAMGAWLGRILAHSKVPPPEGRWREVTPEELS